MAPLTFSRLLSIARQLKDEGFTPPERRYFLGRLILGAQLFTIRSQN